MLSMRPFVVFAVKVMPPGRRRVEMVKLAHELHDARSDVGRFQEMPVARLQVALDRFPQAVPPSRRAA